MALYFTFKVAMNIKIFGEAIIDPPAIDQLKTCTGPQDYGVLTADAHIRIKSVYRELVLTSLVVIKRSRQTSWLMMLM